MGVDLMWLQTVEGTVSTVVTMLILLLLVLFRPTSMHSIALVVKIGLTKTESQPSPPFFEIASIATRPVFLDAILPFFTPAALEIAISDRIPRQ